MPPRVISACRDAYIAEVNLATNKTRVAVLHPSGEVVLQVLVMQYFPIYIFALTKSYLFRIDAVELTVLNMAVLPPSGSTSPSFIKDLNGHLYYSIDGGFLQYDPISLKVMAK